MKLTMWTSSLVCGGALALLLLLGLAAASPEDGALAGHYVRAPKND